MERLLEVLDQKAPHVLVECRARQLLREVATHVLYDVEESNRVVLDSVHLILTLYSQIGTSCFGGTL